MPLGNAEMTDRSVHESNNLLVHTTVSSNASKFNLLSL